MLNEPLQEKVASFAKAENIVVIFSVAPLWILIPIPVVCHANGGIHELVEPEKIDVAEGFHSVC